ncbi:cell envelope integrity protein CreD [Rhodocytophaga rosea]|uniref:Cell envelope integrity protein CreD n=1 Tax=Rhodocytophaga rosea TaxID=2704465 RepID=A0A6C0GN47_9BACT|nr:cell envelope integrity protein CreD [Rhodocytophaga rosea]QHT69445.1 cell envelope integrity protein CreD [Rhodocytophaga rosea]
MQPVLEKPSIFERFNNWARTSITLKLISIGILILILLIPSSMLTSLIYERERYRDDAIDEVSGKWGDSQTIGGPVLTIPYEVVLEDAKGKVSTITEYAHFLPEDLVINGRIQPEVRKRGIYEVVLYNTQLEAKGHFSYPKYGELKIPKEKLQLQDAFISIGIPDMRGIKEKVALQWNDSTYYFNPGIVTKDVFASGISLPLNLDEKDKYTFSFKLNLNGSKDLHFLPVGKETTVNLHSNWNNPSFIGAFLPDNRQVNTDGFTAQWKVLHLNRNFSQQWKGTSANFKTQPNRNNEYEEYTDYAVTSVSSSDVESAAFGVKLLLPIDEYQKTMRSAKYNIMFIFITFLAFFFVEVLNKKRIHPIQYLLVGFAITLFYILLLSISEHVGFNLAYLISCICILLLITFYAKSVLKSNKLTYLVSGILVVLYGFFYSLLQLQDYALLLGSIGLLLILAVVMYLSKDIDWYNINAVKQEKAE